MKDQVWMNKSTGQLLILINIVSPMWLAVELAVGNDNPVAGELYEPILYEEFEYIGEF